MNRIKWMPKTFKYQYPFHHHHYTKKKIPSIDHRYHRHQQYYYYSTTTKENNTNIFTKWKYFMKKYGYVSVGVYSSIGFIDTSFTMALIYFKGADKVKKIETTVVDKIKSITGIHLPRSSSESSTSQPSLSSIFLLALGIHKTILLPFRLFLTISITPTVAKKLVKYGLIKKVTSTKK